MVVQLLTHYSLQFIIIFVFMLAIALKEGMELWKFFNDRGRRYIEDESSTLQYQKKVIQMENNLKKITENIDTLLGSDRDAIKSWIVMVYRNVKKNPQQLNDIEMDLLQRRYSHYQEEGGNSYADNLMDELRQMYNNKEDK